MLLAHVCLLYIELKQSVFPISRENGFWSPEAESNPVTIRIKYGNPEK